MLRLKEGLTLAEFSERLERQHYLQRGHVSHFARARFEANPISADSTDFTYFLMMATGDGLYNLDTELLTNEIPMKRDEILAMVDAAIEEGLTLAEFSERLERQHYLQRGNVSHFARAQFEANPISADSTDFTYFLTITTSAEHYHVDKAIYDNEIPMTRDETLAMVDVAIERGLTLAEFVEPFERQWYLRSGHVSYFAVERLEANPISADSTDFTYFLMMATSDEFYHLDKAIYNTETPMTRDEILAMVNDAIERGLTFAEFLERLERQHYLQRGHVSHFARARFEANPISADSTDFTYFLMMATGDGLYNLDTELLTNEIPMKRDEILAMVDAAIEEGLTGAQFEELLRRKYFEQRSEESKFKVDWGNTERSGLLLEKVPSGGVSDGTAVALLVAEPTGKSYAG